MKKRSAFMSFALLSVSAAAICLLWSCANPDGMNTENTDVGQLSASAGMYSETASASAAEAFGTDTTPDETQTDTVAVAETEADTLPRPIWEPVSREPVDEYIAYISDTVDKPGYIHPQKEDCLKLYGMYTEKDRTKPEKFEVLIPYLNEKKTVTYLNQQRYEMHQGSLMVGEAGQATLYADEKSGLVTYYCRLLSAYSKDSAPVSEEELKRIADAAYRELADCFGFREGMTLTVSTNAKGITYFNYVRMVNDIASPEQLSIALFPDGTLYRYSATLINYFADFTLPADYRERCREAVEKRVNDIMAENTEVTLDKIEWGDEWKLRRLEDERIAVTFEVVLHLTTKAGNEQSTSKYLMSVPVTKAAQTAD